MAKFRKKPVVIEATQWFRCGDHPDVAAVPSNHPAWNCPEQAANLGWIKTLEGGSDGAQMVFPGDWIITGIRGENCPCKPDIFAQTYEAVRPRSEMFVGGDPLQAPTERETQMENRDDVPKVGE